MDQLMPLNTDLTLKFNCVLVENLHLFYLHSSQPCQLTESKQLPKTELKCKMRCLHLSGVPLPPLISQTWPSLGLTPITLLEQKNCDTNICQTQFSYTQAKKKSNFSSREELYGPLLRCLTPPPELHRHPCNLFVRSRGQV